MRRLIVGIDFDNTLVSYDALLERLAVERGLAAPGIGAGKKAIRDHIRRLPDGELAWRKIQGAAYGPRIDEAVPSPGTKPFLARCRRAGVPVYVVSHKTESAAYDETDTNLRTAALAWLAARGFFDLDDGGLSPDRVFFGATRAEKIAHIRRLGCTHFVDDLEETFREPAFPGDVEQILYAPWLDAEPLPGARVVRSWAEIGEHVFSSMTAEAEVQRAGAVAAGMLTDGVRTIEPIDGGRNGRVYCVTVSEGARVALKAYFRDVDDGRDRLAAEFEGLSFLWAHGVPDIPRPLAAARETGYALYEWVDGDPIPPGTATPADLDAAVAFMGALRGVRHAEGSCMLPMASEACFSGDALVANLRTRLARLRGGAAGSADAGLCAFLSEELAPTMEALIARSREHLDFAREVPWTARTLSPSDFGFHNALRVGGRLVFLDFEYFGWDDPAKTIADFVLHPAMQLPETLGRRFANGMLALFADDPGLARRVDALYPLYGLKWCLILLNEFLPEHLARRRFSGIDGPDGSLCIAQLEKARRMLQRVLAAEERFVHAE